VSRVGRIEVVCGPMFSGKSEELLRRLKRARIAKKKYQLFKPAIDDRYSETEVVSHSGERLECQVLHTSLHLSDQYNLDLDTEIVAFDEAQFFGVQLLSLATSLANMGKRVIIAGLDMDSRGKPFGPMPSLMAVAEEVLKLTAVCEACGESATHTYRKTNEEEGQVLVGAGEHYQARCRDHWCGR
jgi:thymidine kinase